MILDKSQHCYLIEGERKPSVLALKNILAEEWGLKMQGNPDLRESEFETLSIDDARKIKGTAITRPIGGQDAKNIFIISTSFIGIEAQNALLKVFEEPIADTYFFLIIPNSNALLPTVLSRGRLIRLSTGDSSSDIDIRASNFLKSSKSERLKILSEFLSHESETKKSDLVEFFNKLEQKIAEGGSISKNSAVALQELLEMKKHLFLRSPSVKMIAEYIAISLPKV